MAATDRSIQHTVTFSLHAEVDVEAFLAHARKLADLPTVHDFLVLEQVGRRAPFSMGLSMRFVDENAYAEYNNHPEHQQFVQDVWLPSVSEFLELDYRLLEPEGN